MKLVLDAVKENGWHHEWMLKTPNGYEWWYLDAISEDRVWSLVAIFLLGNPFSKYYRFCTNQASVDPLAYNGVFFALYKSGKLHHYLFAQYPKSQVEITTGSDVVVAFGPNAFRSPSPSSQQFVVCESNANLRHVEAVVGLKSPGSEEPATAIETVGEGHWWLPTVPAGTISADIRISSKGVSTEVERIRFSGTGYHDHNWGTLPFDTTLTEWTWSRIDFGSGLAAVVYWTVDRVGHSTVLMLLYLEGRIVVNNRGAQCNFVQWKRTKFLLSHPSSFVVTSGSTSLHIRLEERLEDVPFYLRSRVIGKLTHNGKVFEGVGFGEHLKPGFMGTAVAAWGMSRRIYEPAYEG